MRLLLLIIPKGALSRAAWLRQIEWICLSLLARANENRAGWVDFCARDLNKGGVFFSLTFSGNFVILFVLCLVFCQVFVNILGFSAFSY